MMMINRIIILATKQKLMASILRSSNISNPAFSRRFPLECVLQPIDPVFD